jgi:serralysin
MARLTTGSSTNHPEPGDDRGGILGIPGADDTAPDDQGGVGAHVEPGDDKGGLGAGSAADDAAGHESHHFGWVDGSTQASGGDDGEAVDDADLSYLHWRYIYSGQTGRAIASGLDGVFIHGGDGNDAIAAHGGRNVLDGGKGSNFLTGGTGADGGTDTYFTDLRGDGVVWNTLVNFHTGDDVTVWGFQPGTSTYFWAENEGAEGSRGATVHIRTHGDGTDIDASITFAGKTVAAAQSALNIVTGTGSDGVTFLYMHDHG